MMIGERDGDEWGGNNQWGVVEGEPNLAVHSSAAGRVPSIYDMSARGGWPSRRRHPTRASVYTNFIHCMREHDKIDIPEFDLYLL